MALYLGNNKVSLTSAYKVGTTSIVMKEYFDAGGKCGLSSATDFTNIIHYDDTSNVTDMSGMFSGCQRLQTIPLFDTSKVTTMQSMFYGCQNLKEIPALDVSKVTNFTYTFLNCGALTAIHMTGMKVSFDISLSLRLTREALVEIINNLATVTTTQTLTMGSDNLAKLTSEDRKIATDKGWTLE